MEKIRLAIIEDNRSLCQLLISDISARFSDLFEVVGVAHDGSRGFRLITETVPDIVLIDIVLPILDGINILERLHRLRLTEHICCVMLTAVSQDDVTRRAVELGAKYYFLKPFDHTALIQRLIEIYTTNQKKQPPQKSVEIALNKPPSDPNVEGFTTRILQKIGIPANLTGYYYLRMAIVRCIEDPSMLSGLTKELYPSIAKEFKTTGQRVERSIRHSIEKAWGADRATVYYELVGRAEPSYHSKPSNGVFIMDIVDYYKKHGTAK